MDIKKAKEILSRNLLNLKFAGMERIPVKTVEIDYFEIKNKSKSGEEDEWNEHAFLIGMIRKDKKGDCNYFCSSYMVKFQNDHHYCDFYSEAMQVIEALRVVNNWINPYPKESVTVTFS